MDSIGSLLLLGLALVQSSLGQEENSSSEVPVLEPIKVSLAQDSFWEDFQSYANTDELFQNWYISRMGVKDPATGEGKMVYPAKWTLQQPYELRSFRGDQCLSLGTAGVPAMIGRVLPHALDVGEGSKLVVQYEVQLQNHIECGGAFLKLISNVNETDLSRYSSGKIPLELVFGPDKCSPYTNEVHLGLRKTDPVTGESDVKMLIDAPLSQLDGDKTVRLYTLIIDATTQEYEIRINGQVAKAGSLLEEGAFELGFHAPRQIPDTEAVKPDEWDEREKIPDPDARKPDYWDESEPAMILDDVGSKPETWDESMPEWVPDADHERPAWWNDNFDGEWVAPLIRNPECFKIAGCGPWEQRMMENPDYWGPWEAPLIENPNYHGIWEPPLIDNPNFFEDLKPGQFENPIGGVVFEVWSGTKDLLIDNLYIGHHVEEAESLGNETFVPKKRFQEEQIEAQIIDQVGRIEHPRAPPTTETVGETRNFFDTLADRADLLLEKFSEQSPFVQNVLGGSLIVVVLFATSFFFLKTVMWQQDRSEGLGISKSEEKEKKEEEEADSKLQEDGVQPAAESATGVSTDSETLSRRRGE